MTWLEAQERFGSDKPDVRFGMELVELTELFEATEFNAFKAPCIKGIRVPGGGETTRSRLDDLTDRAKRWGAKGLVWMRVKAADGGLELESPVAKFLSDGELAALPAALDAEAGDLVLLVADDRPKVCHVLGLLRLELGRPPVTEGGLQVLWVVDFPLLEQDEESGRWHAMHHPFTAPKPEDAQKLFDQKDLGSVRANAYDLVINGTEIGGGSIRIHERAMQEAMFRVLGFSDEDARYKFGFLMDAFEFGAPPHGGAAFGFDRWVSLFGGRSDIREFIAFPKNNAGRDTMIDAPSRIDAEQLKDLGLATKG